MPETEPHSEVEISPEEQSKFLEAIAVMPESGIAFRGDPATRAKQLQNGLNEPQINYILFTPGPIQPKIWGKEAASLYRQLNSAIDMALVYADPWYETGARTTIADPNFVSYRDYYTDNPAKLPAITWFTETQKGQFAQVIHSGRTWLDYDIRHYTGDISSFGSIPAENVQPTIVLDDQDIERAEEHLLGKLEKDTKVIQKVMTKLNLRKRDQTRAPSLKSERVQFREELGKIATIKLCEQIISAFKTK